MTLYRFAVLAMVMFGAIAKVEIVWSMADLFMGLMAVINLIVILLLGKVAFHVLDDFTRQRKQGKNPVFKADPGLEGCGMLEGRMKKIVPPVIGGTIFLHQLLILHLLRSFHA